MTDTIRQKLEAIRKVLYEANQYDDRATDQVIETQALLANALEVAVDALEKWRQPGRAAEERMEKILADIDRALGEAT